MFEFMVQLSQFALPIFIFLTMANIGLTQDPRRIVSYWRNWPFYAKMLLANFVVAPAIMWTMLNFWPLPLDFKAGLAIFSLVAGAPFIIKLTATSDHDLALGAATMMLLVMGTIVVVPLLLPVLLPELSVNSGHLVYTLIKQLLLPMVLGGILAHFTPALSSRLQPWAAKGGNIALYVVLVATIIGYLPQMSAIIGSGALIVGLLFILAAFAVGYLAGKGEDHLEDVGALATAQRNTAAAMLIATSSFEDSTVFVLITLVNTIGFIVLIALAKRLKGDNCQVALI